MRLIASVEVVAGRLDTLEDIPAEQIPSMDLYIDLLYEGNVFESFTDELVKLQLDGRPAHLFFGLSSLVRPRKSRHDISTLIAASPYCFVARSLSFSRWFIA